MRKVLIFMALTLIFSSGFAAKTVMLKCNQDSYTSLLAPDTNYGKATELDAQSKFTFTGTTYTNRDSKVAYFNYGIPSQLIGKVRVTDATISFYATQFKASSPYKAGEAIYYIGLYPCLNAWNEMTITFNNSPTISGPAYFEYDSTAGIYKPKLGFNDFKMPSYGIQLLQKAFNSTTFYGMALLVDVSGPNSSDPLIAGDYLHLLRISSRDNTKKMSFINLTYELKTGNMINGSNINTASLGEVKAKYH